VYLNGLLAE